MKKRTHRLGVPLRSSALFLILAMFTVGLGVSPAGAAPPPNTVDKSALASATAFEAVGTSARAYSSVANTLSPDNGLNSCDEHELQWVVDYVGTTSRSSLDVSKATVRSIGPGSNIYVHSVSVNGGANTVSNPIQVRASGVLDLTGYGIGAFEIDWVTDDVVGDHIVLEIGVYNWSKVQCSSKHKLVLFRNPAYGATTGSVARLYEAYFLRAPDLDGMSYWTDEIMSGASFFDVSDAFSNSLEFRQTYGQLGNEAFVDLAYQNIFGRQADRDGKGYWMELLAKGLRRGDMILYFSDGDEFRNTTGIQELNAASSIGSPCSVSKTGSIDEVRWAPSPGTEYVIRRKHPTGNTFYWQGRVTGGTFSKSSSADFIYTVEKRGASESAVQCDRSSVPDGGGGDGTNNCDYSNAANQNGWGWDDVAKESCHPDDNPANGGGSTYKVLRQDGGGDYWLVNEGVSPKTRQWLDKRYCTDITVSGGISYVALNETYPSKQSGVQCDEAKRLIAG